MSDVERDNNGDDEKYIKNEFKKIYHQLLITAVVILLIVNGIFLVYVISDKVLESPDVDMSVAVLPNSFGSNSLLTVQILIINNEDNSNDIRIEIERDYQPEVDTLSSFTENEEFVLSGKSSKMYNFEFNRYGSEYFFLDVKLFVNDELLQTIDEFFEI